MELVTLQFQIAINLWKFRLEIESNVFEINLKHITLTCKCSNEHIELAINKYKATVTSRETEPEKR